MIVLAVLFLALALIPAIMTVVNVAVLRVPAPAAKGARIAILIPARDEEKGIADCVQHALASTGVALEVIVLDDGSTDATAIIVTELAARDPRLMLASAPPLPPGWTGKQHACHVLSTLTDAPHRLFLDADVHLAPEAAARLVGALARTDLVSGVPRQRMESLAELLIIPMINMLLLGYLPIPLARIDARPALAAACGQMIAVRAEAYTLAGGHAKIRTTLHDGLTLPRLFRASGLRTDLLAGASLASCRMYKGWRAVIDGTTKNATEALARPIALPIWTVLLLGGHVLSWFLLVGAIINADPAVITISSAACVAPIVARLVQAWACREPLRSVPLDPLGVVLLLALQWLALGRKWAGRPATWRGRSYSARS